MKFYKNEAKVARLLLNRLKIEGKYNINKKDVLQHSFIAMLSEKCLIKQNLPKIKKTEIQ